MKSVRIKANGAQPVCFTRKRCTLVPGIIVKTVFLYLIDWALKEPPRRRRKGLETENCQSVAVYYSVGSQGPAEGLRDPRRTHTHTHTHKKTHSFIKTCKLCSLVKPANICLCLLIEWTELIKIIPSRSYRLPSFKTDKKNSELVT